MQMSTKYGVAFLCMPKCASTSIEQAIKPFFNINFAGSPNTKHINAQFFFESLHSIHLKLHPRVKIESFCLMRDPLDWIESWYRYRSRNQLKNKNNRDHQRYTGEMSYDEFIKEYISKRKRKPFASIDRQYNFLAMNDGEIGVDHIIPMNRMDLVSDFLSKKIGREIKIQNKNISPKSDLSLDIELEKKLRQHLLEDIAMYEFIETHGQFNKALHSDKFFASLKACR
jgi:hypothetical protein